MKTVNEIGVPGELLAELQEAADRASNGTRDAEAMHRACDHMDRLGEIVYKRHGVLNIGVPAIRELRDQ